MKRLAERLAALALTLAVGASSARAQRCAGCAGEDTVPRGHVLPALGLHVGTPQKASVALGVVVGQDWQKDGRDHSRNVALFAEPGLGAGRASIAYLRHGYGSWGSGFGIAATALRTWKQPWQLDANQTYAGGEVFLWPIFLTGPRVGLLRRVSGSDIEARRWFITLDLGFGL